MEHLRKEISIFPINPCYIKEELNISDNSDDEVITIDDSTTDTGCEDVPYLKSDEENVDYRPIRDKVAIQKTDQARTYSSKDNIVYVDESDSCAEYAEGTNQISISKGNEYMSRSEGSKLFISKSRDSINPNELSKLPKSKEQLISDIQNWRNSKMMVEKIPPGQVNERGNFVTVHENDNLIEFNENEFANIVCRVCPRCRKTKDGFLNLKPIICEECNVIIEFECLKCTRVVATLSAIYSHVKYYHRTYKQFLSDETNAIIKHCPNCTVFYEHRTSDPLMNCASCSQKLLLQCVNCKQGYESYKDIISHFRNNCGSITLKLRRSLEEDFNLTKMCPRCDRPLKHIDSFRKHVRFCGKEPDIFCSQCNYKTCHNANFKKHVINCHMGNVTQNNLISSTDFAMDISQVSTTLNDSQQFNHPLNVSVPSNLDDSQKSSDALPDESSPLNLFKRFCLKCDEVTENRRSNNKSNCAKCDLPLLLQCSTCDKRFDTYKRVVYHVQNNCVKKEQRNECLQCGKVCSSFVAYKFHSANCGKETIYNCAICSFATEEIHNLKEHVYEHINKGHLPAISNVKNSNENINASVPVKIKKEVVDSPMPEILTVNVKEEIVEPPVADNSYVSLHIKPYCSKCKNDYLDDSTFGNVEHCDSCQSKIFFKCLQCNEHYNSIENIYIHINFLCGNKEELMYSCYVCEFSTDDRFALQDHKKTAHSDINFTKISECRKCGKKLKNMDSLRKHFKRCGTSNQYYCQYCPYITRYRSSYLSHRLLHSVNYDEDNPNGEGTSRNALTWFKRYCASCDESLENSQSTKAKNCPKCESSLLYQCTKCNETFDNYNTIAYHLRIKCAIESASDMCEICGKIFFNSTIFQSHVKRCSSLLNYCCDLCPYRTTLKRDLLYHINMHTLCDNNFTYHPEENLNDVKDRSIINEQNRSSLIPHMVDTFYLLELYNRYCTNCEEISNQDCKNPNCQKCNTELIFKCVKCNISTNAFHSIIYHLKTKCALQGQIHCSKCDFKTSLPDEFRKHIKTEHPRLENCLTCNRCNKLFKSAMIYKNHRKHCGYKPKIKCFFCDNCEFKTKYKNAMEYHVQIHLRGRLPRGRRKKLGLKKKYESIPKKYMKAHCVECNQSRYIMHHRVKCRICKNDLQFRCTRCDVEPSNYETIRKHIVIHFEEYECTCCGKKFADENNLKMHKDNCSVELSQRIVELSVPSDKNENTGQEVNQTWTPDADQHSLNKQLASDSLAVESTEQNIKRKADNV